MSDNNFKPYIPAEKSLPEFTATSVILGILLAVLFGGDVYKRQVHGGQGVRGRAERQGGCYA